MQYIIVFLIVVIILILNKNEYFNNDTSVKFLTIDQGCYELKKFNNLFNYTKLDMKLRNINNIIYNDQIYKFYCSNILEFNNIDKKLLLWIFDTLKKHTPEHLTFLYNNIKICKYKNDVENGYPHTNGDIIFLTESFIDRLLYYFNANDEKKAIKNIGFVIIHECVHIWQRQEPHKFEILYVEYWNFLKAQKIFNSEELKKKSRFNPDGIDLKWILHVKDKYIWLLSVYDKHAKDISHVKYIGVYVNKIGKNTFEIEKNYKYDTILDIPEFNYLFNNITGNHYHPNELSAELISIYYLKQMKISHRKFLNRAYKKLEQWFYKIKEN